MCLQNLTAGCDVQISSFITDLHDVDIPLTGEHHISDLYPLQLDVTARDQLRMALDQNPHVAHTLFEAMCHPLKSISQWAYDLALELGAPCGRALAALLPGMLVQLECQLPTNVWGLRCFEAALLRAIELTECLAPDCIVPLYRVMSERRGREGASPWWTFRIWQRLTQAMQGRLAAKDIEAIGLVQEMLAVGGIGTSDKSAHWHADWAAQQLVPYLPST